MHLSSKRTDIAFQQDEAKPTTLTKPTWPRSHSTSDEYCLQQEQRQRKGRANRPRPITTIFSHPSRDSVAAALIEDAYAEIKVLALVEGSTPPSTPVYCLFQGREGGGGGGEGPGGGSGATLVRARYTRLLAENRRKYQVYFLTCALETHIMPDDICYVYISTQKAIRNRRDNYVMMPLLPIQVRHSAFGP